MQLTELLAIWLGVAAGGLLQPLSLSLTAELVTMLGQVSPGFVQLSLGNL